LDNSRLGFVYIRKISNHVVLRSPIPYRSLGSLLVSGPTLLRRRILHPIWGQVTWVLSPLFSLVYPSLTLYIVRQSTIAFCPLHSAAMTTDYSDSSAVPEPVGTKAAVEHDTSTPQTLTDGAAAAPGEAAAEKAASPESPRPVHGAKVREQYPTNLIEPNIF
jgi:hypothetical protein